MTDRYVWFFNQVVAGIQDEFPDKRLAFYAYSVYNRPPVKVKPSPKLVPAVALITLCRLHGMDNPVCPEKSYERWVIEQWGQLVPEVYYRGYWFNLADPGLPFFMMERIRREVPLGKQLGIAGWRVEAPYEWAGSTPSRYVASKLMWDHTADVDRLMDDFYAQFLRACRTANAAISGNHVAGARQGRLSYGQLLGHAAHLHERDSRPGQSGRCRGDEVGRR